MNRLIETITGQADHAKPATVEQEVEIHGPNETVRVQTVRLNERKLELKAPRKRLVERRRRRTGRRS